MIDILRILQDCADRAQSRASTEGHMPPGHNGPHRDKESWHRNTSHWLITYSRLFLLTGVLRYADFARTLADSLMRDPYIASGRCPPLRDTRGKDSVNGVIGLAWIVEALAVAGGILDKHTLVEKAAELALYFPFDESRALWAPRSHEGNKARIDNTIDHQLWFAMAASHVTRGPAQLYERLEVFCDHLPSNLQLSSDGLFKHMAGNTGDLSHARTAIFIDALRNKSLRSVAGTVGRASTKIRRGVALYDYVRSKEVGYHIFTLHALVRLQLNVTPGGRLAPLTSRAIRVLTANKFLEQLDGNPWAFPYNAPGFEAPLILLQPAVMNVGLSEKLVRTQKDKTFDETTKSFSKNNPDHETLSARMYCLSLLNKEQIEYMMRGDSFGPSEIKPGG